jgi:hypothetical protein
VRAVAAAAIIVVSAGVTAPPALTSNATLRAKLSSLERLIETARPPRDAQTDAIVLRARIAADVASSANGRIGKAVAIQAAGAVIAYQGLRINALLALANHASQAKFLELVSRVRLKEQQARDLIERARSLLRGR